MAIDPTGSKLDIGITGDNANLGQVSGDIGNLIEEQGGTLGPEIQALLELQEKVAKDTQTFALVSQILKNRDDAAKQAINNI